MVRGDVTPTIALDTSDVRAKFDRIKEFSPKLARSVRRDMRRSGDEIIAEQRAVLDGPLPRGVAVTGRRKVLTRDGKTGTRKMRVLNTYADTDVKNAGRSRASADADADGNKRDTAGLRAGIKAGLKTRVVISSSRTGVSVRTTNAKRTGSNFWQAKRFRHPSWGNRERMVYQAGQPYFWAPAFRGAEAMVQRVDTSIDAALKQISDS